MRPRIRAEAIVWLVVMAAGFLAWSAVAANAAETGVVTWQKSGCDWYVAETGSGSVLLEWFGGGVPYEGNSIAGDLNGFGMKDLLVNGSSSTRAWIDDYMLSRSRVAEKLAEKCR